MFGLLFVTKIADDVLFVGVHDFHLTVAVGLLQVVHAKPEPPLLILNRHVRIRIRKVFGTRELVALRAVVKSLLGRTVIIRTRRRIAEHLLPQRQTLPIPTAVAGYAVVVAFAAERAAGVDFLLLLLGKSFPLQRIGKLKPVFRKFFFNL